MTSEVVRNPTYTYMAAQRLTEMQKKKKNKLQDPVEIRKL